MLTSAGPIEGWVENIAFGGAFIRCERIPESHETFRMVITVPNRHRFLRVTGKTARSAIYHPDDAGTAHGIGVRFVDMSDEDRRFLTDLISAELPPEPSV
jgi:hypothetical protein